MVNWQNPETKAKLYAAIFEICDVKVSAAQMKEIADRFEGATPKAISHQVHAIRTAKVAKSGGGKGGDDASPDDADESDSGQKNKKKASTKKRSAPTKAKGGAAKKVKNEDGLDDEELGDAGSD